MSIKSDGPLVILEWTGRRSSLVFDLEGAENFLDKLKKAADRADMCTIQVPSKGKVAVRQLADKVALVFTEHCTRITLPSDIATQLAQAFRAGMKLAERWVNREQIEADGQIIRDEWRRLGEKYDTPADRALLASTIGVIHSAVVGVPTLKGGVL